MNNEIIKKEETGVYKYNPESFLQAYNPKRVKSFLTSVNKPSGVIALDSNSIALHRKEIGEKGVKDVICLFLIDLNQNLNVNHPLKSDQILEISNEIISSYYFLSVPEIGFVFKKAKRGDYGSINFAINMPDVMQWFAKYTEERTRHFQQHSEQESKRKKQGSEIKDGKLFKNTNDTFTGVALEVLKKVKEEIPKGFDKEAYKQFKEDYERDKNRK